MKEANEVEPSFIGMGSTGASWPDFDVYSQNETGSNMCMLAHAAEFSSEMGIRDVFMYG